MSTKIHQLIDGNGLPLVILCCPGQAGDSPMLGPLLQRRQALARPGCSLRRTRADLPRWNRAESRDAVAQPSASAAPNSRWVSRNGGLLLPIGARPDKVPPRRCGSCGPGPDRSRAETPGRTDWIPGVRRRPHGDVRPLGRQVPGRRRLPRSLRPWLPAIKAASVVGLVGGERYPWLGRSTSLGLTTYFIVAVASHLRAAEGRPWSCSGTQQRFRGGSGPAVTR